MSSIQETMSAAMEGAIDGLQAIGFSLLDYSMEADFSAAAEVVMQVATPCVGEKNYQLIVC